MQVRWVLPLLFVSCSDPYSLPVYEGGSGSGTSGYSDESTGVQTVTSGDSESSGNNSGEIIFPDMKKSICGNNIIEHDEECDRGNLNNNFSACTEMCMFAKCGDDYRQIYNDIDENQDGGIDWPAYSEECDDGNLEDGDGCSSTCKNTSCGDGIIQFGEHCDDGPNNGPGMKCKADCTFNICGDGDKGPNEQCDDANDEDLDGCRVGCAYSPRLIFVSSKSFSMFDINGNPDIICQNLIAEILESNPDFPIGNSEFKALISHPDGMWYRMNDPGNVNYYGTNGELLFNSPIPDPNKAVPVFNLQFPIAFDEKGLVKNVLVWTGVDSEGVVDSDAIPCDGWKNDDFMKKAGVGSSLAKDSDWYKDSMQSCNQSFHLYCVQVW